MAKILVGNKNNIFTSAFNASTKTLSLSNITTFDMTFESLVSVFNVTRSSKFNFENMTVNNFSRTFDANGLPVYNWVFDQIPASSADTDTLTIFITIPDQYLNYTALLVIATATI